MISSHSVDLPPELMVAGLKLRKLYRLLILTRCQIRKLLMEQDRLCDQSFASADSFINLSLQRDKTFCQRRLFIFELSQLRDRFTEQRRLRICLLLDIGQPSVHLIEG